MAGMFQAPAPAHTKGHPSSDLDSGHPALVLTRPEHLTQEDQVRVSGTMTETLQRNDGADVAGHGRHHSEGAGAQVPPQRAKGLKKQKSRAAEEARLRTREWNTSPQKGREEHPMWPPRDVGSGSNHRGPEMCFVCALPPAWWDLLLYLWDKRSFTYANLGGFLFLATKCALTTTFSFKRS